MFVHPSIQITFIIYYLP